MIATARARRVQVAPVVLSAPALAFLAFFVAIPMVGVMRASLADPLDETALTLANYIQFFSSNFYLNILVGTAVTSAVATMLALLLGYPLALYLVFAKDRWRRYLVLIVISPLLISVVVRAYALMLLMAPGNPIDRLLPEGLSFDLLYTRTGVIVGLIYTLVPFMVLSISSALSNVDRTVISASYNLGAGTITVIRRIILPLSVPGIISGSLLVFILSITSVALPLLLGGTRYKMLVYLIYQQFLLLFNWPFGYAISVILLVATGLCLVTTRSLSRRPPGEVMQ